jgi:predicted porin
MGAVKVTADEGSGVTVRYTDRFNLRARNAVMYVSPPIAGVEVRALLAPGEGRADDDIGTTSIASFSAVYKSQILYFGAAYEQQWRYEETDGTRLIGGLQFESTQLNLLFERLDSSRYATLDRMAGGASFLQRIGDATFELQAFRSMDYFEAAETGGMIYAVGATYKLSKQSEIYGIVARMDNETNAGYMLAAGDHGEHYLPTTTGAHIHSASMGMVFKF